MNLLKLAKKDEQKAPNQYKRLLRRLKSVKDKRIVRSIIKDEKRHLKMLKTIK